MTKAEREVLVGSRYGRLVITGFVSYGQRKYAICKCDCGNTKEVRLSCLLNGSASSCGCYRREQLAQARRRRNHTMTTRGGSIYEQHGSYRAVLTLAGFTITYTCYSVREAEDWLASLTAPTNGHTKKYIMGFLCHRLEALTPRISRQTLARLRKLQKENEGIAWEDDGKRIPTRGKVKYYRADCGLKHPTTGTLCPALHTLPRILKKPVFNEVDNDPGMGNLDFTEEMFPCQVGMKEIDGKMVECYY